MPRYYIYLISSLPELVFALKPPISLANFLQICRGLIPEQETGALANIALSQGYFSPAPRNSVLEKWQTFDRDLRNELVRIRASRKKIDPLKYLRKDGYVEPRIGQIAINAHKNPSLLEGQRILDQARWDFLKELSIGHYFDSAFLVIYVLKLLILERWQRINTADRTNILEEVLK